LRSTTTLDSLVPFLFYSFSGQESSVCGLVTVRPTGPARSGQPDDRLRETHRLLLRYARAVTSYRQNFICGGSFIFTANPAERRLRLLVDDIVSAKDGGFCCRSTHPTSLVRGRFWRAGTVR
jgi:hypothetical protein